MVQQNNCESPVAAPFAGRANRRRNRLRAASALLVWIACAAFSVVVAAAESSQATAARVKAPAGAAAATSAPPSRPASASQPAADGAQGDGEGPFSAFKFSANNGPVQIHSNTLNVDYKSKLVEFQGDVHATQSGTTLTSQTLKVIYGDKFNQIQTIIALGDVKMVQGGRWVTGQQAVLDEIHHTLEVTGSPVIHDGPDKVAGNRIIVYLDSQKSFVEGASAVIFPHASTDGDHEAGGRQPSPPTR